ncbi:hypothetical protein IEQ44_02310 [Nocardioides sp. Y6]|uniref:Sulfotransferase family protein n=1 Tax=Nocardioides malaquae TaxID=2773426 RepID=A0ABR9RPJ8_9ACTN|nr:hypothetical protein [Nocardioides malaquae]MBE7323486.1 hypothetical protein [Nocardioides malaquae]
MARRVFLHIGPPKTGTSFLQQAWYQHRSDMAERGLLYPGVAREEQFQACAVAVGKRTVVDQMRPEGLRAWDRLTRRIEQWEGDALLSSEHYALGRTAAVAPIMERLHAVADEVHLLAGARDLARQIPADWQQTVKQGSVSTFDEFWRNLAEKERTTFWFHQDLPTLLQRWGGSLPGERVHVVVHGRPGTPHSELWLNMCSVLGIEPDFLGPVARTNESLDAVQVELIRRMNLAMGEGRSELATKRAMRSLIGAGVFADETRRERLTLPAEATEWLVRRSQRMVDELRAMDLHVVGDLDDLLVPAEPPAGRVPDVVSDAETAALAPAVIARLVETDVARRRELRDLRDELAQARRRTALPRPLAEADPVAPRGLAQKVWARARGAFAR